jgi:hypothetical protein
VKHLKSVNLERKKGDKLEKEGNLRNKEKLKNKGNLEQRGK